MAGAFHSRHDCLATTPVSPVSDRDRLTMTFDVLVLGGGAAGCVLAARLSEDPARRVGLVEAGPDYGPLSAGRWPRALLDARVDGALIDLTTGARDAHDWGYDAGRSASRARVIGGCSSHNGCEVLWGAPSDYDEWADLTGDAGWSYTRLLPYLQRADRTIEVRPSRVAELSPIRRSIIAAGRERGLAVLPHLNAPGAVRGVGGIPVNARGTLRWGAAFAYLDAARPRPNLLILADSLVDRVTLDGGRATGAIIRRAGREEQITAGTVIVAAGSYGTPAILGRSGIGPAAHLRTLGIRPAVDLPGVGARLLDHAYVLMSWAARPRLQAADDRIAAGDPPLSLSEVKWPSSHCRAGAWDTTVGAWSGTVFDQRAHGAARHLAGMAPCVMKTVSRGQVTLRSADPTVLPGIDHGFLSDPDGHDLAVLVEAVGLCRDLAGTRAWRYWCGEEVEPGPAVRGPALETWLRANVGGSYHPSGTARMGKPADRHAVVDSRGRVFGVDGLAVVDASIFPSIPAANIHLSVLAVAEKLAAELARD